MIKSLSVALLLVSASAHAHEQPCDALGSRVAHAPVEVDSVVFCFTYTSLQGQGPNLPPGPEAISIHAVGEDGSAQFIDELPYSGTESIIDDAFVVSGQAVEHQLAVIHSSDAPSTFDIAGRLYDVTIIDAAPSGAAVSTRETEFFDIGADLVDASGAVFFRYPYKHRQHVIDALASPLIGATADAPVPAEVMSKAFLYQNFDFGEPSGRFLIQGDRVLVEDASGGWCQVRYTGKAEAIIRWMQCELLAPP